MATKLGVSMIARIVPFLKALLSDEEMDGLWKSAQPKKYRYKLKMSRLPLVMMCVFMHRIPSIAEIASRWGEQLGTKAKSTLSEAFGNSCLLKLVTSVRKRYEADWFARDQDLVAIDSMPVTIPSKRRSDAKKMNDKTIGGGFLWAFNINARTGTCPVKVFEIMRGMWSDTKLMGRVDLLANGPIYLLDRGFFCFDLLRKWLSGNVRFIVRAKKRNVTIRAVIRTCGEPCKIGRVTVSTDAVVQLDEKRPIVVRLVWGTLPSGEPIILVSGLMDWSAAQLLDAYHQRWHIERFHNLLKDAIGLAHLYSFRATGMEILAQLALILAVVIWMSSDKQTQAGQLDLVKAIRVTLNDLRRQLGLGARWRRNISVRHYGKQSKQQLQQAA